MNMISNPFDWEVLTYDQADLHVKVNIPLLKNIDEIFEDLVPLVVFYNKRESFMRVFMFNVAFLLFPENVPNLNPIVQQQLIDHIGLPDFPIIYTGKEWGIPYRVSITTPKDPIIRLAFYIVIPMILV